MLLGPRSVELGEAPERDSEVVKSDAAGDLALLSAPGERALEERDRFGEVFRLRAEFGEGGREVVQDAGMPAALFMVGEMVERHAERFARPREVGGGPRAS